MSDVSMTRANRNTLLAMQTAIEQARISGERIGTGKRVNTAVDDPSAYFTGRSLSDQAAALSRVVEQLGQGIQVVKAADNGITAMQKVVDAANALIGRAAENPNAFDRAALAKTFNEALTDLEGIAEDSGYQGKNLLGGPGNDLKLYFSDDRVDALAIEAVDYTDITGRLGLPRLEEGAIGRASLALQNGGEPLAENSRLVDALGVFAEGDELAATDSDGTVLASLTITATTTVGDLTRAFTKLDVGLRASFTDGTVTFEAAANVTLTSTNGGGTETLATLPGEKSSWFEAANAEALTDVMKAARETLRLDATSLGMNLTILQNRESFMKGFAGTLISGSETLTAADKDEEAANLLALQLRQQFSANALTISSEADQGVLRLLG
ncbi:flagellin [Mongoliimonas terrestris]|uniref:flagellin n=1 Tax=Mongoliimonas terrestris TaxID=1709001 RepID=UPI00094990C9|nr:flagellin [Mongoliimonas terrestris]